GLAGDEEELRQRIARSHSRLCTAELRAQEMAETVAVQFAAGDARGVCAVARRGVLVRTHAGVPLSTTDLPDLPVFIAIEEPNSMPTPGWDGVLHPDPPSLEP